MAMQLAGLNFRHLYYFWVVVQEGSITRAAERLGVAVQTISSQLGLLDRALGTSLLAPQGRRLLPTAAGQRALVYADQIFLLGAQLQQALAHGENDALPFRIGISNSLPKLLAYRLLEPMLQLAQPIRLVCHEGQFEPLLADLALHKLDVVLADRPASASTSLRVFSHALGEHELLLFGMPALAARYRSGFPASLHGAPLLLPTRNNTLRARIEQWLDGHGLQPQVLGEFEDNALLNTFGRSGLGMFCGPAGIADEVGAQFGAEVVGALTGVRESVYAVSSQRKISHPALAAILAGAHAP